MSKLPKEWSNKSCSLITAFSLACTTWKIEKEISAHALLWAWCENQVSIGVKLIPLGQTHGQQVLSKLMESIQSLVLTGLSLNDKEIGATCPGLVMASMRHEDQYSVCLDHN